MTAPAPPRGDLTVLDRLISAALQTLRAARVVTAAAPTRRNLERQARAEEHLDALLDYRHAVRHR
ncbi:hypothetical protein ACI8AF_23470 [Blastococcus sp. SYSU D00669]